MRSHFNFTACLVLALLACINGQDYLSVDQVATAKWTAAGSSVQKGNGAFMSKDGDVLVVVGLDGSVRKFDPSSGAEIWKYSPKDLITSNAFGGAFFSSYEGQPYVLFALISNATVDDEATSQLIALNPKDGSVLYESAPMDGIVKGTPVTSNDGSLLIATHNVAKRKGFFSIFQFGNAQAEYTYASGSGNSSLPFSAVGYFWKPREGNYPEGVLNPNDIFIWALDTPGDATEAGAGQMFAFQKPLNPAANLTVYKMGDPTSTQTPNPPILTNEGYSMYWSLSKSTIRFWLGDGLSRNQFANNFVASVAFERGVPAYMAPGAPVTLSSDPVQPFVYGPSAGNEIVRMPYDLNEATTIIANTSAPLTNKVLISPDDLYIYYANEEGSLYQLDAATMETVWNVTIGSPVLGELALSPDGAFVYVADLRGEINAFQVMERNETETVPTSAPADPVDTSATSDPVDTTATSGPAGNNPPDEVPDQATAPPDELESNVPSMQPTAAKSNAVANYLFSVSSLVGLLGATVIVTA